MSADILERVLREKRIEMAREMEVLPMRRAIELASSAAPPHDFVKSLRRTDRVNVIAEVKAPAPGHGSDGGGTDAAAIARSYADAGAAALSVLTDSRFSIGSPECLQAARASVTVPILRKDFIFDEYQIYRSRALGADAVLLFARALGFKVLQTLIGVSRSLHMESLVEVRSEEDLQKALDCGSSLVAVNNRDLGTMTASLETSLRLAAHLPSGVTKVSESGIETRADIDRLRAAGYDAFLVGECLTRSVDPSAALQRLVAPLA